MPPGPRAPAIDPELAAALCDALDIPRWALEKITDGEDPHAVLGLWAGDLARKRDLAARDIADQERALAEMDRDPYVTAEQRERRRAAAAASRARYEADIGQAADDERRLEKARGRLAELMTEHEAARLAREQAQAAERAERDERARVLAEQHRAVWEAEAAERAERARVLAEQQRREAAELRRLQLAGLVPLPATWWGHLMWLHRTFGDRAFTAAQACEAAHDDPDRAMPPRFRTDLLAPDYPRYLGMAYANTARQDHDGTWIAKAYVSRGVRRWHVVVNWDAQLADGGPATPGEGPTIPAADG